jgi:beta-lactamase class A
MKLTRRESLWMIASVAAAAADDNLEERWQRIARETDGTVGAAALELSSGHVASLNGDERFPLASVCKLPIAMHMLALTDEGKFSRDQMIEVLPRDVVKSVSRWLRVLPHGRPGYPRTASVVEDRRHSHRPRRKPMRDRSTG